MRHAEQLHPRLQPMRLVSRNGRLYTAVALWAHAWLLDPCHPEPCAYLRKRGFNDATISRYALGVTLSDPDSLVVHLRETCPEAFPYAEEAGLVVIDDDGQQRTHWNLRGCLIFPYITGGEVVDLRTRIYNAGKGYRSLGPYAEQWGKKALAYEAYGRDPRLHSRYGVSSFVVLVVAPTQGRTLAIARIVAGVHQGAATNYRFLTEERVHQFSVRRRWQRIERATLPPAGRSGEQALPAVTFGDDALWTPHSGEQTT